MTTRTHRVALVRFTDLWRDDLSQQECRQRSWPTSTRTTGVMLVMGFSTLSIASRHGTQPRSGNAVKDFSGITFARWPTRFRPPLPRDRRVFCPVRVAGERVGVAW